MPDSFCIIAIDPGANGGIAWNVDGKNYCVKMPPNNLAIKDFLRDLSYKYKLIEVHLENPSKGGWGMKSAALLFKFYQGIGFIEGVSYAYDFKLNLVDPRKWQKAVGMEKKPKEPSKDWKNRLKVKAEETYPDGVPITLWSADALLILSAALKGKIVWT